MKFFKMLIILVMVIFLYSNISLAEDKEEFKVVTKLTAGKILPRTAGLKIYVWTGGFKGETAYADVHGPNIAKHLSQLDVPFEMGEETEEMLVNAELVSMNPLSIAPMRKDVYEKIREIILPNTNKKKYNIRRLSDNAGIECLFLVSSIKFNSFNDVVSKSSELEWLTRTENSGDTITLDNLITLHPGLVIDHREDCSNIDAIIETLAINDKGIGFFVEMADPSSSYFQKIKDKGLFLIPVTSWQINQSEQYQKVEVKVAYADIVLVEDLYYETSSLKTLYIIGKPTDIKKESQKGLLLAYVIDEFAKITKDGSIVPTVKNYKDSLDMMRRPFVEILNDIITNTVEIIEKMDKDLKRYERLKKFNDAFEKESE